LKFKIIFTYFKIAEPESENSHRQLLRGTYEPDQLQARSPPDWSAMEDMSGLSVSNVCQLCGKASVSRRKLKQHMFVHSEEQPHKCGTCDRIFKLPHNLKNHI